MFWVVKSWASIRRIYALLFFLNTPLLYFLISESWAEETFNYFLLDPTIKISITSQSTLHFGTDRVGKSGDCGRVDHSMQERGLVLTDSQTVYIMKQIYIGILPNFKCLQIIFKIM